MGLRDLLRLRWDGVSQPFLVSADAHLSAHEVIDSDFSHLTEIQAGDVVALIGDFEPRSISDLIELIDRGAILVPLTNDTTSSHEYFFESALVDFVVSDGKVQKRFHSEEHPLIQELRRRKHPGLVLFSTGTTGRPKAILHDMSKFLARFETPRPTYRTVNFLLFDHIGGINTLLHTLFNTGVVIAPAERTISSVLKACEEFSAEVLPTTPTFLRFMLLSGQIPDRVPACLKLITYGTERMDQPTLNRLCELLPDVDFRQTFGMSELGIVRVKSKSRDSLFMKIGGEGVTTRVVNGVLEVLAENRMMGYLNADSPFDREGWYNTGDVVEVDGEYISVIGRTNEVINVGGLKFMASEVERVALELPQVSLVKVEAKSNPITGQHVEMTVQRVPDANISVSEIRQYLSDRLPSHMIPARIKLDDVSVGHRFKRA